MLEIKNKKIAVVGFGREGQALAAYFYANHIKADYFDQNESAFTNAEVLGRTIIGPHNASDLSSYDLIFRSPGLSPNNNVFSKVSGQMTSLTELFISLWPGKLVGVTGTKGKGTTSSLIESICRASGYKVLLVGNIGYVDLLTINEFDNNAIAIMEMSSFQLMKLGSSPGIAVVLDITADHLDYHRDLDEYVNAKLEIIKHQQQSDWAIITASNPRLALIKKSVQGQMMLVGQAKSAVSTGVWWLDDKLMYRKGTHVLTILSDKDVTIVGIHNKINIAAAAAAAICLGIEIKSICRGVADFKGLPQRLEHIATCHGVKFINDSASTNPVTAAAALKAITGPVVMLIGGRNKGLNYALLVDEMLRAKHLKHVICYGECGPEIGEMLRKKNYREYEIVTGFFGAMQIAVSTVQPGDTILLSPAAASFDEFNNSVERGKKFNHLVHEYCRRKF